MSSRLAKTPLRAALAALLVLLCCASPALGAKKATTQPLLWGAWIGPQLTGTAAPFDMSATKRLETVLGKGLSLLQFAAPFADCNHAPCKFSPFPTDEMQKIRDYGAIPVFSWSSGSTPGGAEQPDFQLGDVLSGRYDSYIRGFADEAKAWGHPFFLRFNWEMNGSWFPWAEAANGNRKRQSKAVWRHVHDIFAQVGATNASWVWCPYAGAGKRFAKLAKFYPGNRYVDWTCMDGYNWAGAKVNPVPWMTFEELFSTAYKKIGKIAPNKPMLLGEIASNGKGGRKAPWIRGMFKSLATKFTRIRGLVWFDQVDRGVDWPLETSKPAVRAFRSGLRKNAFLGNEFQALDESPTARLR